MSAVVVAQPVTYKFIVRDNQTGEERLFDMDCEWFEHTNWFLTEGNFGCDCNRGLSFARAGGMSEAEIAEIEFPCGDGRYTITKAILSDGSEVEIDGACDE